MKVLLIGKSGQLGRELEKTLLPLGKIIACDRAKLDLGDPARISSLVREFKPAIIVNAAAYTAVDKAESEPALAQLANAVAPGILAEEARRLDALLVHYSTDYVFDGTKSGPYTETDRPNPLSVYGQTKLEGERAIQNSGCRHLIFRTCWVYGPSGKNFLLTMLKLARERDELRVVDDQIGAPTTAAMIAKATTRALGNPGAPNGLYHLSAAGQTSWCGFAKEILRGATLTTRVTPIPASDYPTPAQRPQNSVLDNAKFRDTFGFALESWEEGLKATLSALNAS